MLRGGELMAMGGCDAATQQRLDIYNVQNDSWRSVNTGIRRNVPATVLLPDGTVLLLSGENPDVNQIRYRDRDASSDPRYPQTFDPETLIVTTEIHAREDTFRGYHNFASVVADGSIMLGSGFNQFGDVGCENPNVRLFFPSYLFRGPRPSLSRAFIDAYQGQGQPLVLHPGQQNLLLPLDAGLAVLPLHASRGVALLAVQDFTHSYGENQRYVILPFAATASNAGSVTVNVPTSPTLFDGQYLLFLLSASGVPSIGLPVRICTPGGSGIACPQPASVLEATSNISSSSGDNSSTAFVVIVCIFVLIIVSAPIIRWAALRRRSAAADSTVATPTLPGLARKPPSGVAENPIHSSPRLDPGSGVELKDRIPAAIHP